MNEARIGELREKLDALRLEQATMNQRLQQAEREDHERRTEAARMGNSFRDIESEAEKVRQRNFELPFLIIEKERELAEAKIAFGDQEQEPAQSAVDSVAKKLLQAEEKKRRADEELEELRREHLEASAKLNQVVETRRAGEEELKRLEEVEPETPARI